MHKRVCLLSLLFACLSWTSFVNASVNDQLELEKLDQIEAQVAELTQDLPPGEPPWWLGNEDFHRSHQSNLLRKDPVHYAIFDVPDDLPYLWPMEEPGVFRTIERN